MTEENRQGDLGVEITWAWEPNLREAIYYIPVPEEYKDRDEAEMYSVRIKHKGDTLKLVELEQMETDKTAVASIDPFDWDRRSKRDDLCAAVADVFGFATAEWFSGVLYWITRNHHKNMAQTVREDTERMAEVGALWIELNTGGEMASEATYVITDDGMHRMKTGAFGALVPLSNFSAHVVRDVIEDDGIEERRVFEVEARLRGGRRKRLEVSAEGFDGMNWVPTMLGIGAAIEPGMGNRDHVARAIRLYSQHVANPVPESRLFVHTGWRTDGDEAAYLHAGGMISGWVDPQGGTLCHFCATGKSRVAHSKAHSLGENDDLCHVCHKISGGVSLRGKLARRSLPAPVLNGELVRAVQESFKVWDVVPDSVIIPADAYTKRAVIDQVRDCMHIVGPSGWGKTSLALILQNYFGRDLEEGDTGGFESTSNALEGESFLLKDQLFVLDDYLGTPRHQRVADRMYRAAANKSGRNRAAPDGTPKGDKPPRGLLLSTGEDLPHGYSLGGRILFLRLRRGDVDFSPGSVLSEVQEMGRDGTLARSMAGFVAWLASSGRRATLVDSIDDLRAEYRPEAQEASAHRRTPTQYADMVIGLTAWLDYAFDIGAITPEGYYHYLARGRAAIMDATKDQAHDQNAQDPVERLKRLVVAAIASGRAHVRDADTGEHPAQPWGWGWERVERGGETEYMAKGATIGYLADDGLYLDPTNTMAQVKRAGEAIDEPFHVSVTTMGHHLKDGDYLLSARKGRGIKVRKRFGGQQVGYWHVAQAFLDEPGDPEDEAGPGPGPGGDDDEQ
jgi:hypothetical protein